MRTTPLIWALIAATASAAVVDTSFMDEREKLAKDWTGKGGDPAWKYFRKFLELSSCSVFPSEYHTLGWNTVQNVRLIYSSR